MASQNQPTPDNNSPINNILDTIIEEKHYAPQYDSYGATSGQSLIQRYFASLAAREPITIALTVVPVMFLLIIGLAVGGGGQKSGTGNTSKDSVSDGTGLHSADDATQLAAAGDTIDDTPQPVDDTSGDNTQNATSVTQRTASPTTTPSTSSTPSTTTHNTTQPPSNTVVVTPTPVVPPVTVTPPLPAPVITTPPISIPSLKIGKLCTIGDKTLTEASGLAASIKFPGIFYTHNDEAGAIYAVRASDCKVVSRIAVNGFRSGKLADPEAIAIDHTTGKIWFGDIGNGHPGQTSNMTSKPPALKDPSAPARIMVFSEPASLTAKMSVSTAKIDITYQGGMQNSEALLVNPKTGQGYIINKLSTSTVYSLPKPLKSGVAKKIGVTIKGYVTDATFTNDGKWILIRYRTASDAAPTNVLVYDANWKYKGTIAVPKVMQGESIAMDQNGPSFVIGSEGLNSPLVRIALPNQYK